MGKNKRKLNIKTMNLKNDQPRHKFDFKVDRTTPLGNPYYIKEGVNRKTSIKLYKKYFKYRLNKNSSERTKEDKEFLKYFNKLINSYRKYGKLRLFCHCAPLQCHIKIIIKNLKKVLK